MDVVSGQSSSQPEGQANELAETDSEKYEERNNGRVLRPRRPTRSKTPPTSLTTAPDNSIKNRWSEEEKMLLYEALKQHGYGANNLVKIAEKIPNRTPLEVMSCMKYWKRMATIESVKSARNAKFRVNRERKLNCKKIRKGEQVTCDFLSYIEMWIEEFEKKIPKMHYKSNSDSEGVYALSSVLLVISQLEAHPLPEEADGLDFKELYLFLYDLLNGNPMKKLAQPMMKFLGDSFKQVIELTKSNSMVSQMTYANYVAHQNVETVRPVKIKTYHNNPTKEDCGSDFDKAIMEQVINLPYLNPLKIQVDERIKKPDQLSSEVYLEG